jgi:ATP-dependent helicase HepA
MSEREPELGLGVVASVDRARIGIRFPATGDERIYAAGSPVLRRVTFRAGETVAGRDGRPFAIEGVEEEGKLLVYVGGGRRVREDEISDVTSVAQPQERLLAGQVDEGETFDLRLRAIGAQARFRQSEVRGFLGGRLELIPHQLYILHEVASRQIPRVLLADEVGLGKTIEACLIVQRLLATGRAARVLVLVPETLVHQWFVELLRRFNLWFSIYDESRCLAAEAGDPGGNPFLGEQLVLASVSFLSGSETRGAQAVAAGWDMVVVDEAHHLAWSPESASPEYRLVEQLAAKSPGLLLLTATPTQLGLEGHFARLRLLDPDRYSDFEAFSREAEGFAAVAEIAGRILEEKPLKPKDHAALKRLFTRDPEGLDRHLGALTAGEPGARDRLIRTLLDQHGTGRVIFRNTRAAMTGFPKRKYCPARLAAPADQPALLARLARELEAEETGNESAIRYSFREDPRLDWLAKFLKDHKAAKVLLICRSQRKVAAIEAALQDRVKLKVGLFHEGLPLVQRDRNAAWFAEPDGAQLLLCSEIGSEGRNFQFAHHLVLFDLPLNPGLVEQRIGRLDRIGQTETIRVHVPFVAGGADEVVARWYDEGLDAFETPLHGGTEFIAPFRERLLVAATGTGAGGTRAAEAAREVDALVAETAEFRKKLLQKLAKGRDRLLELNSFRRDVAERVIEKIRAADTDKFLRTFMTDLLDHFGVRLHEHEGGDVFLDPSHAYIEGFPSIPREGMLATYDRRRAIAREDIRFISQDHPLVRDAIDLLLNSPRGSTAFGVIEAKRPNLLLEAVFVLETVAEARWHVDEFLAPTPVRVLVDVRGGDLTEARPADDLADEVEDGNLLRFLESPGFNAAVLKAMLDGAQALATTRSRGVIEAARTRADDALGADLRRLTDLRRLNDHVRPEEIALAQERLERTREAIVAARLRLDSLRLVVEGPVSALRKD